MKKTVFEKWILVPMLVIIFFIPVIFLTGGTGMEMFQVAAAAISASVVNNLIK